MNSGASSSFRFDGFVAGVGPSQAEMCAMRADGEVWRVGPGHILSDVPVDVRARLAAILAASPPGLVLMGLSAAWVWDCLDYLPDKFEVARADGMRLGTTLPENYRVRDVAWSDGDIITTAVGCVTSIQRTMLDIARYDRTESPMRTRTVLGALEEARPGSATEALQRLLESAHLPYKSQALVRLSSVLSRT